MSKPWDNEPTPLCEKYEMLARFGNQLDDIREYVVGVHDARNLERRMRAAERLLEDIKFTFRGWKMPLIDAHLEATRKEDKYD